MATQTPKQGRAKDHAHQRQRQAERGISAKDVVLAIIGRSVGRRWYRLCGGIRRVKAIAGSPRKGA